MEKSVWTANFNVFGCAVCASGGNGYRKQKMGNKKTVFTIFMVFLGTAIIYFYAYQSFQSSAHWSELKSSIQSNYFKDTKQGINIKLPPLRTRLKFSGDDYAEIEGLILIDNGSGYKNYYILATRIDGVWVITHLKKKRAQGESS